MEEFVPFDPNIHKNEFIRMNIEYMEWIFSQLDENYQLDSLSKLGMTVPEIVNATIEPFLKLKPPEGIIYLLIVEGDVAGMGALEKLSDEVGEIKRMYSRPQYRGRGYGKIMLNRLLEVGRQFGCSSFRLDTPKWAHAAQHIYRSAGFKEREEYPESEIPPNLRSYWLFMEKNNS